MTTRDLPHPVAILGAGTMGTGIAGTFARHGASVRLLARREEQLQAALAGAGKVAESLGGDSLEARSLITTTTDADAACDGASFVIETIAELLEPKRSILRIAEAAAADDAVIVSNTSSLPLGALADVLQRPERFAGYHWFNPPDVVELVEVIGTDQTDPAVLETLAGWTQALDKAPIVVARDVPGFVANRLQYALVREAFALVEAGVCEYADVDRVLTHGLGARWAAVGPFQIIDLGGVDVWRTGVGNLFPELSREPGTPAALSQAADNGALGCKAGRGLLGTYDAAQIEQLRASRDAMLRAIAAARRAGP